MHFFCDSWSCQVRKRFLLLAWFTFQFFFHRIRDRFLSCTDDPHWFICNSYFRPISHSVFNSLQLAENDHLCFSSCSFFTSISNTCNNIYSQFLCLLYLRRYFFIPFIQELPPFRMTNYNPMNTQGKQLGPRMITIIVPKLIGIQVLIC